MLLKNRLFTFLAIASFFYTGLKPIEIEKSNLFTPGVLGDIQLHHEDDGFSVIRYGEEHPVRIECIDKELRNISDEDLDFLLGLKAKIMVGEKELELIKISPELANNLVLNHAESLKFSEQDSEKILSQLPPSRYIEIFQYSDGEYGLHLRTRLLGGGLGPIILGIASSVAIGFLPRAHRHIVRTLQNNPQYRKVLNVILTINGLTILGIALGVVPETNSRLRK